MDVNSFSISGTVRTIQDRTTAQGAVFRVLVIDTRAFMNGGEAVFPFEAKFFREQGEALALSVRPGDYVLVSGKVSFRKSQNGGMYPELQASSWTVVRQAARQQEVDPADIPPVRRQPVQPVQYTTVRQPVQQNPAGQEDAPF